MMEHHRGLDSSSVFSDGPWDGSRELRALRDVCARSRAEEASILRRSAEEAERCALRRSADESAALQDFLSAFREAIEVRLESQQSKLVRRIEALERRVDTEAPWSESGRAALLSETLTAVRKDLDSSRGDVMAAVETSVSNLGAKISSELAEISSGVARSAAAEILDSVTVDVSSLRQEVHATKASWVADSEKLDTRLSLCSEMVETLATRLHTVDEVVIDAVARVDTQRHCLSEVEGLVSEHQPRLEGLEAWHEAANDRLESLAAVSLEPLHDRVGDLEVLASEARALAEEAVASEQGALRACDLRGELGDIEIFSREEAAESMSLHQCMQSEFHSLRADLHTDASLAAKRMCEKLEEAEQGMQGMVEQAWALESGQAQRFEAALGGRLSTCEEDLRVAEEALGACKSEQAHLAAALPEACARAESVAEARMAACCEKVWQSQEASRFRGELADLRREATANAARWRVASTEASQSISTVSAKCTKLAAELSHLQQQGLAHEWSIPRIRERIQYLSIGSDVGVWLDSPEFSLGSLGDRLTLRLYPSGAHDGDGQCAVGLHDGGNQRGKRSSLPLRINLAVQGLSRKAALTCDSAGGALWLASGFGTLDNLIASKDALSVAVEVPACPWGILDEPAPLAPATVADLASASSLRAAEAVPPPAATHAWALAQKEGVAPRGNQAAAPDAVGSKEPAVPVPDAQRFGSVSGRMDADRGSMDHLLAFPYSSTGVSSAAAGLFDAALGPMPSQSRKQRPGWASFGDATLVPGPGPGPTRIADEAFDPKQPRMFFDGPAADPLGSLPCGGSSTPGAAAASKVPAPGRAAPFQTPLNPMDMLPPLSTNPFDK